MVRGPRKTNQVAARNEAPRFRIRQRKLIRFAEAILKALGYQNTFLSIVFVSNSSIRHLNQKYLSHSWVTDVLAFPFGNSNGAQHQASKRFFLGEIVISPAQARVNARRFGTSYSEELARYICHGLLHLKGHSDHSVRLRNRMRRMEERLVRSLGTRMKGVI